MAWFAATNGVVVGVGEEPEIEGLKIRWGAGSGFGLAISRRPSPGAFISYFRFLDAETS
jgi:hypothetical protein